MVRIRSISQVCSLVHLDRFTFTISCRIAGSETECQYQLMTFGIPVDLIPLSETGDLKTGNHIKWLARRRRREIGRDSALSVNRELIDLPRGNDVLFGRGRPYTQHEGNRLLHQLIAENRDVYDRSKQGQKIFIRKAIAQAISADGGRFLRLDSDGGWVKVDDETARDKIGHAFRSARKPNSTKACSDDAEVEIFQAQGGKRLKAIRSFSGCCSLTTSGVCLSGLCSGRL